MAQEDNIIGKYTKEIKSGARRASFNGRVAREVSGIKFSYKTRIKWYFIGRPILRNLRSCYCINGFNDASTRLGRTCIQQISMYGTEFRI